MSCTRPRVYLGLKTGRKFTPVMSVVYMAHLKPIWKSEKSVQINGQNIESIIKITYFLIAN